MHIRNEKRKLSVSRRSFLAALAGLPILSLPFNQSLEAATIPNCSFVYVTDVHLTSGVPDNAFKMLQESQLFLQDIIKGINALKPDFVIFGGDQVETVGNNDGNWQFFIDIMQGLNCPWYFVLGEQDVSGKIPVDKMKEFGPDFKGRGLKNNAAYWSCDPVPNLHLIGLDTSQANKATGDISAEQLAWLKTDLAANRGKFTIVVSHHPLLAPPPYDGGPPLDEYTLPNGSDAREILGGSLDVRMVLSGHLYMNKVQLERDVYHVSCAGLNVYPCQYKYFKIGKDAISMESFEVPLPKLIKKAETQLLESSLASKLNRRKPDAIIELCKGAAEDQNASLSLGPTKSVRAISKKQLKADQERRNEVLEKEAEALKNKNGKSSRKERGKSADKDVAAKGETGKSADGGAGDGGENSPLKDSGSPKKKSKSRSASGSKAGSGLQGKEKEKPEAATESASEGGNAASDKSGEAGKVEEQRTESSQSKQPE